MKPTEVFALTAWTYLSMAWLGKVLYFKGIDVGPALYAILFLSLLLIGENLGPRLRGEVFLPALILLVPLGSLYFIGGLISFAILFFVLKRNLMRKAVLPAVLLAVSLTVFACIKWGIPVLKPELRYTSASVPFLVAGDIIIGTIAVFPDVRLLVLGEAIALISASRTVGLGVATAYALRMAYDSKLTIEELKRHRKAVLLGIVLLLAVFLARYYVTVREYSTWRLGFLGSLLYRPASSYTVYERLFHLGMPLGKRELLFNPDPTGYVGELFGKDVGYTYTLFGQPAYDFGILGLIEALILGLALGRASKNPFTGTFALTVAILALDIGIEAQFLVAILLMAYLAGVKEDG
ncbi:hypothetical protein [Thermococcus sp.]|uniref:hypothetical protein n=1 Tax=Thermococcus sp. TaxID=35749 RepID=UPI0026205D02|nr:hypothetical protein [Thermococcus sp.]